MWRQLSGPTTRSPGPLPTEILLSAVVFHAPSPHACPVPTRKPTASPPLPHSSPLQPTFPPGPSESAENRLPDTAHTPHFLEETGPGPPRCSSLPGEPTLRPGCSPAALGVPSYSSRLHLSPGASHRLGQLDPQSRVPATPLHPAPSSALSLVLTTVLASTLGPRVHPARPLTEPSTSPPHDTTVTLTPAPSQHAPPPTCLGAFAPAGASPASSTPSPANRTQHAPPRASTCVLHAHISPPGPGPVCPLLRRPPPRPRVPRGGLWGATPATPPCWGPGLAHSRYLARTCSGAPPSSPSSLLRPSHAGPSSAPRPPLCGVQPGSHQPPPGRWTRSTV